MYDEITYSKSTIFKNTDSRSYLFPSLRIVLVTDGESTWIIGREQYKCEKGDIVLLNNCMERMITDVKDIAFCLDIFEFSPAMFADRIKLIERFYDNHGCVIKNNLEYTERIRNLLTEIKREIITDSACKEEFSMAMLTGCLILARQAQTEKSTCTEFYINTALRAASIIWTEYKEELNAAYIAQRVGIANGQLEKSFKAMFGQSISTHIRNYRMYRTMQDIRRNNGQRNILDIAFENGFSSSSGFYKAFKAINNSTPSALIGAVKKPMSFTLSK